MKITRTDKENSFMTVLKVEFEYELKEYDNKTKKIKIIKKKKNGDPFVMAQKIEVPIYEADIVEKKLKTISISDLQKLCVKSGSKIIKE